MGRFDFHGLVIETSSDLEVDPAQALFSGLPAAEPGAAAAIRIRLAPGRGDALRPGIGGPPDFVHGDIQIRTAGGAVEVSWPGVLLRVVDGQVDGLVDPDAVGDEAGRQSVAQAPLLVALTAALRYRGHFHLHAACLVLPEGDTVLMPAQAGSGKSTLAAALVQGGACFLGDDTLFVRRGEGGLELLALPRPFHLSERSAAALGLGGELGGAPPTRAGKGRYDFDAEYPGRQRWSAPAPSLLLLPSISGQPATRVVGAQPIEALGALLQSSSLVASPGSADHLPVLSRLVDGARCFQVALGLDLLETPTATARRILEGVNEG